MKIELTKDEWEFLKEIILESYASSILLNDILEKLGSEWVDDE